MDISRYVVIGFSLLILVSLASGLSLKVSGNASHQFARLLILIFVGLFIYSLGSSMRKE